MTDSLTDQSYMPIAISLRTYRYRYISSKIRPVLTIDSAKIFYYGMVNSIVCYGLLVWGAVPVEDVSAKRLCKLQDRII